MARLPSDPAFDSTVGLLRAGYEFVGDRADELGSDAFEGRLLLRRTIFLRGPEAARVFYDSRRFQREGAAPGRVKATLFGRGGVQGLDGEAHRHRKAMFMALMTPERIDDLDARFTRHWRAAEAEWAVADRVVLFDAVERILFRAVFEWAGVPYREDDVGPRTADISAMIDGAGAVGPRHWRGRVGRRREERRVALTVEDIRAGRLEVPTDSAAHGVAFHEGPDGERLPARTAAVEILNVVRPVIAIARYVAFVAHALQTHADRRPDAGDGEAVTAFVQEVRRLYPFFPFVAARVRETFEWNGYTLRAGRRAILDLYSTDRHPAAWEDPDAFRPERFRGREVGAYDLIPQGGGEHHVDHRCAGEWITIRIMERAVRLLSDLSWDLPPQNLAIDLTRFPAIPESRVVIRVRPRRSGRSR